MKSLRLVLASSVTPWNALGALNVIFGLGGYDGCGGLGPIL